MARILGVADGPGAGDPLGFIHAVQDGLPVASVALLSEALAPNDAAMRYSFVPKATYERRRKGTHLSPEESARVARVAGVFALARDVWGSEEEARKFLGRPHPLLDDATPLATALGSDLGARLVERILGRLLHGTAA